MCSQFTACRLLDVCAGLYLEHLAQDAHSHNDPTVENSAIALTASKFAHGRTHCKAGSGSTISSTHEHIGHGSLKLFGMRLYPYGCVQTGRHFWCVSRSHKESNLLGSLILGTEVLLSWRQLWNTRPGQPSNLIYIKRIRRTNAKARARAHTHRTAHRIGPDRDSIIILYGTIVSSDGNTMICPCYNTPFSSKTGIMYDHERPCRSLSRILS